MLTSLLWISFTFSVHDVLFISSCTWVVFPFRTFILRRIKAKGSNKRHCKGSTRVCLVNFSVENQTKTVVSKRPPFVKVFPNHYFQACRKAAFCFIDSWRLINCWISHSVHFSLYIETAQREDTKADINTRSPITIS